MPLLTGFNLSEWALQHRGVVLYFMVTILLLGAWSYTKLGQSEDPPFTFKVMLVRTEWSGATARDVEQQVTEKIERKLQELEGLETVRSFSRPGESMIFVVIDGAVPAAQVPELFYQVRKKVGDIHNQLPEGTRGPFFNDEFGDTFGNIYALYGDDFSPAQLKDYADEIRRRLLRVPDVGKIDLIGEQEEKIWIEASTIKLATLAIDVPTLINALKNQNAIAAAGYFETPSDRIYLRVDGGFKSIDDVRELNVRINGRTIRIGDVAKVHRGYTDPPSPRLRYMGHDAIGMGVSMRGGGDIVALGRLLENEVAQIQKTLPVGLELVHVNDQPRAVRASVSVFTRSVAEAVMIVLAVSFFSLGFRTGLVVAISIPLVLAATFACMYVLGIGLHKISLGSLILALGLLVDDAIIAVEMMTVKMEQGMERVKAASFAYVSTAFPMLSGTLVTAAGFLPIATAHSTTGEYTRSIFQVVTIALLISWVAAVVVIPYLGFKLLPDHHAPSRPQVGHVRWWSVLLHFNVWIQERTQVFYRHFRRVVEGCVARRRLVLITTLLTFLLSLFGFKFVQQQFFPDSTRLELLVDLKLAEGASLRATQDQVQRMEKLLDTHTAEIENYVSYVGTGSPRFYLPLDQQMPAASFAQFVITTKGIRARESLRSSLIAAFDAEQFPAVRGRVLRLENGPPVGFPVQFRVSGENLTTLRNIANQVAAVMRANPHTNNVQFDWDEQSKVIRLEIDQAKARALGVSSQELALFLNTALNGGGATYYREKDKLIEVMLRGAAEERGQLALLENLSVPTASGKRVPLAQVVKLHYEFEEGIIWRRDRLPTITVRADIYGDIQAPVVSAEIEPELEPIKAALPTGYLIQTGGAVEESAKGSKSIAAGMPLFILTVLTVLIFQLRSFQRVLLVVLTAPLGMIGVTVFLLLFNKPFGFVAMLGTIALFGMIMRNSVILIDQIEQDIRHGETRWNAIIGATVRRFRPIVLTAMAAILAMIPLTRSAFFGPMAVAIMGGLFIATVLTLLYLPALYAAWFRVRKDEPPPTVLQ
ncbi:MAG: efflux RND transporter permease subunit [Gammaproteobacteria bacterium]|nr:efflux RND transporter permease subunit [Gammaproteobacteria bacterium]